MLFLIKLTMPFLQVFGVSFSFIIFFDLVCVVLSGVEIFAITALVNKRKLKAIQAHKNTTNSKN